MRAMFRMLIRIVWVILRGLSYRQAQRRWLPDAVRDFGLITCKTTASKSLPFFISCRKRKDTDNRQLRLMGATLKKQLIRWKHDDASIEMLNSRWAQQVGRRANRLSQQWREDRYV